MTEEHIELPDRYDITPSRRTLHAGAGSSGPHDPLARGSIEPSDAPEVTLSNADHDVGQLIAGLLDGELERRLPLTELRWFRRAMGVAEVRSRHTSRGILKGRMMLLRLARLIREYRPSDLADSEGGDEPMWTSLPMGDEIEALPISIRVAFPAGTVLDYPVGVSVSPLRMGDYLIGFICPAERSNGLKQIEERLLPRGKDNPYQGHALEVFTVDGSLDVRVAEPPSDDRSTLIMPPDIWREIDQNVINLFQNRKLLADLDLGLNRGILLTGPPGTGKTHLTRVVAAELVGSVTVLFVSPESMRKNLRDVYELAEDLAPSLVVLEDVDLAVARRSSGGGESLNDFLVSIDGAMTEHTGIVTIATTNDVDAIDDAAKRAARFDRIVEVPMPPAVGRRRIWDRYLEGLDGDFDIDQLVRATRGGSGADIRELVRHAILVTNGAVTTGVLVEGAKERGLGRTSRVGQYL